MATTLQAQEVKNIIYLIGDGMGLASASMMQLENNYEATIFDRADNIALQKTYSLDNRVTDSAAAGTALFHASGQVRLFLNHSHSFSTRLSLLQFTVMPFLSVTTAILPFMDWNTPWS